MTPGAGATPGPASVRVGDFRPRVHGFHFRNAFAPEPIRTFKLGNVATLDVGDAANGLCGGMSTTVRDLFVASVLPPPDQAPPGHGDPRFDYLVERQIASFEGADVPLRFYKLMNPFLPDREPFWAPWLGALRIDRHSRTWVMVNVEWPAIRRELDGGELALLGLVKTIDRDPAKLGRNHQVVAYGYDLAGSVVTLRIYDPNLPDDEDVTLRFDTADAGGSMTPTWSRSPDTVFCFFREPYRKQDPTPFR
jgi:hypothetical protein